MVRGRPVRTGERYGKLVTLEDRLPGQPKVKVRCDCGAELTVWFSNLGHHTNSCGCTTRTRAGGPVQRHGGSTTRLYGVWSQMLARCTRPTHRSWPHYGGRGIRVCDEWLASFAAFYRDVGDPPDDDQRWTIDRIDNDGNYEPTNVRWATYAQQRSNQRVVTRTHCPLGHPFDEENTYVRPGGRRLCRTCRREYWRRRGTRQRGRAS